MISQELQKLIDLAREDLLYQVGNTFDEHMDKILGDILR